MPRFFRDTSRWAKKGSGAVPFETIVKRKRSRIEVPRSLPDIPYLKYRSHHHRHPSSSSSPELIAVSIYTFRSYTLLSSFDRFSFRFFFFFLHILFFCIPVNGYRFREFGQIHKKKRICVMIVACRETPFFPSCCAAAYA